MLNKALSYIFSVEFLTKFLAGTEILNISEIGTGLSVPVKIVALTETKPNFGRSLINKQQLLVIHFLNLLVL